jgi:hypothetical protein
METKFLREHLSIIRRTKPMLLALFIGFTINSFGQLHPNDAYNLQQASDLVNGYAKLFEVSPEEKARREAQAQAQAEAYERQRIANAEAMERRKSDAKSEFKTSYIDKYIGKAGKGDQTLQLFLVYMMKYVYEKQCYCDLSAMLPNWENWLKKAVMDKDVETITLVGYNAINGSMSNLNVSALLGNSLAGGYGGAGSAPGGLSLGLTPNQGLRILEDIATSEESLPILGIRMDDEIPLQKKTKNTKSTKGVYIKHVEDNSAAHISGLLKGDVLMQIDDKNLNSVEQTQNIINTYRPGDSITITYLKGGKESTTIKAALQKRPLSQLKVDVMMILGDYYNRKGVGENPEKALLWYTHAAVNGSPNAMFNLGQIYTTAVAGNGKLNVKHKVKKDPKTAFNWYLKSIENPNYTETYYSSRLKYGSFFRTDAYDEVIKMYRKGIGCEKSEENAAQIANIKDDFLLKEKLKEK